MSERNEVQRAFDEFSRLAGLEKQSGSWYCRCPEVVTVTNLQKSNYGRRYYINQGFWIRAYGDEQFPKPQACHIQARLGSLVPDKAQIIDDLLNLAHSLTEGDRTARILALLQAELEPLIRRGCSIEGLRVLAREGHFRGAGLTGEAQHALELD